MLFKNPPLQEAGVAAQCLWMLFRHWYLPVWHCLRCWGSKDTSKWGFPKSKSGLDTQWGPMGNPMAEEACTVLAVGWSWLSLSLWVPQPPHGVAWGQVSACPTCEMGACGRALCGAQGAQRGWRILPVSPVRKRVMSGA